MIRMPSHRRRLLSEFFARIPGRILCLLASACATSLVLSLLVPQPAAALEPALSETTTGAVAQILTELKAKSSARDPRYFKDSIWRDGTPDCFRCTMGPAVLSAVYSLQSGLDGTPKRDALASIDRAIREHQAPNGSFGPAAKGENGPAIQTVMFGNLLASSYLHLGLGLDGAHRKSWSASLTAAADYLIRSGHTRHYVNGNINLAITAYLDLTARITGQARFRDAAKASYAFTIAPPQDRWSGFGLRYTKVPTKADGSDGRAYLSESGGKKPGYDAAYGLLQTNIASMWYQASGDERARRLTNLLFNQLWPRVRTSDWSIDVSGGTRRPQAGVRFRFSVSAIQVLPMRGGRADLKPYVRPATLAALRAYQNATTYANPGESYNFGIELATSVRVINSTLFW